MLNLKKSILSMAAIATVSMAGGDVTPVEINDVPKVEAENSFLDRFHFKSDLRLRYESIERDDADNKYRNRYRFRLGAKVDLIENLQLEIGVRSGFGNPTSGNQTFLDDEPLSDYFFDSLKFNIAGLAYKSDNSTSQKNPFSNPSPYSDIKNLF